MHLKYKVKEFFYLYRIKEFRMETWQDGDSKVRCYIWFKSELNERACDIGEKFMNTLLAVIEI